ncbi:MAG: DEAD/DEAH box helicase [Planctomycetaceae bacterium]|nr:DEAD/DEAH box helicase [Planctomycetaceae bacterium]
MIPLNEFLSLVCTAIPRFAKNSPNVQQRKCILHHESTPLMIVAGPGSGKTTVLVLRALRFVFVNGWMPEQIVITTFTRKAADELRARLIEWGLLVRDHLKSSPPPNATQQFHEWLDNIDINRFVTGTLDALCEELLTTYRDPSDPVPVLVEGFVGNGILAQRALFPNQAHSDQDLSTYLSAFTRDGSPPSNFGDTLGICRTILDRFVHDMVDLKSFQGVTADRKARTLLVAAVKNYRDFMADGSRMDFALLEETFLERLRQGRLQRFTQGVKAMLIDEYQDTNPLQESIYVDLVGATSCSLTIVGDDDQSLYRFRGATVELFNNFQSRFSAACTTGSPPHREDLTDNYRSTPEIVEFFNNFITCDPNFQTARVTPPKPVIVSNKSSNGVPVLGLFRPEPDVLADDLTSFLMDVFRNGGRTVDGVDIVAEHNGGDCGDAVLLSHTVSEYGPQFGQKPPKERLPKLLRDRLASQGIEVFNPRGRFLRDIPQVQQLLGVVLECIDGQALIQSQVKLRARATRYLDVWRQAGTAFISSNPHPSFPHTLADFVQSWQGRQPQAQMQSWPVEWPLLELCFKVISWLPFFQDDPEGQVYLEAISRCVAQAATFSSYRSQILNGQGIHDENSVKKAIQDIFAPIAESAVEVDEEIMPHIPRNRFPIMTIHQSKGLEFPLVIVDVASDYKRNHPKNLFRRFPKTPSSVQNMEDDFAAHCEIGPLRQTRTGLERSFDDLVRLYYVAYSRPESVLLLVGLDKCLHYKTNVKHVALGWTSDESWAWRKPVTGKPPAIAVNDIPLRLI